MCSSDVDFVYVIYQLGNKYLEVQPGTLIRGFETSAQSLITRGFSSSNMAAAVQCWRIFLSTSSAPFLKYLVFSECQNVSFVHNRINLLNKANNPVILCLMSLSCYDYICSYAKYKWKRNMEFKIPNSYQILLGYVWGILVLFIFHKTNVPE